MIFSRANYFLSILIFLFLCSAVYGQTKVIILKADELIGRTTASGEIRVLKGNVSLKIKENTLQSDSALHYLATNEIRAFGKVFIENETDRIWADSVTYDSKAELSYFYGNLLIEKDSSLLFSNRATYSFSQKTAYFPAPFQLEDKQGILKADRGIYFHETDSISFRGNVQLSDSTFYMKADSLLGNRNTERYELFGNVLAIDEKNNSRISSEYAFIDSSGYRLLKDRAEVIRVDSAKADTMSIKGQLIEYFEHKDSTYSFSAFTKVQIKNKDFASFSDSATYESEQELFELFSNAYSWNNRLQLSAPYIRIEARDDTIRQMKAYPFPFAVQEDSVTGRFQQMKGDSLTAYFEVGKIHHVRFAPNATAAFFSSDDSNNPDGLMIVHSNSVILYFENDELANLSAEKDVQATYSEEAEGVEAYRLNGFSWRPELKPKKIDVPDLGIYHLFKIPTELYPKHYYNNQ